MQIVNPKSPPRSPPQSPPEVKPIIVPVRTPTPPKEPSPKPVIKPLPVQPAEPVIEPQKPQLLTGKRYNAVDNTIKGYMTQPSFTRYSN